MPPSERYTSLWKKTSPSRISSIGKSRATGCTSALYDRPVSLRSSRSWMPARKSWASRIIGDRAVRAIAVSTSRSTEARLPWTISSTTGSTEAPPSAVSMPNGNAVGTVADVMARILRVSGRDGYPSPSRSVRQVVVGRTHVTEPREDPRDRELVLVGRETRHRVRDELQLIAVVVRLAGRRLDAHDGRDAADHDGRDAAFLEPLVQLGLVEGADRVLHDHEVTGLLQVVGESAAGRLLSDVRPLHPDQHHRAAGESERVGQASAAFEHLVTGVRLERQRDDPRHQVDQYECRGHPTRLGARRDRPSAAGTVRSARAGVVTAWPVTPTPVAATPTAATAGSRRADGDSPRAQRRRAGVPARRSRARPRVRAGPGRCSAPRPMRSRPPARLPARSAAAPPRPTRHPAASGPPAGRVGTP